MYVIKTTHAKLQQELDKWDDNEEYLDIPTYTITNEHIQSDVIVTDGPVYVLTDRNIAIVEGMYCNYNEETNTCEPDWSLTLIYELDNVEDSIDIQKYDYYEQDPPITAIHNYTRIKEHMYV